MSPDVAAAVAAYAQCASVKMTAQMLRCSYSKAHKLLVSAGLIETAEANLFRNGLSAAEIARVRNVSRAMVYRNIPYTKGVYNAKEPTQNALRIRACRQKKQNKKHPGQ